MKPVTEGIINHLKAIDGSLHFSSFSGRELCEWMSPLILSISDEGAVPYLLGTENRYRASPLASVIIWLDKSGLLPMEALTILQDALLVLRDNIITNDSDPGITSKYLEDQDGWSLGEAV